MTHDEAYSLALDVIFELRAVCDEINSISDGLAQRASELIHVSDKVDETFRELLDVIRDTERGSHEQSRS